MVVKGGREEEKDRHKHGAGVGIHHVGDQRLVLPAALHFSLEEKKTAEGRRGVRVKKNGETLLSFCNFAHLSYLQSSCL